MRQHNSNKSASEFTGAIHLARPIQLRFEGLSHTYHISRKRLYKHIIYSYVFDVVVGSLPFNRIDCYERIAVHCTLTSE